MAIQGIIQTETGNQDRRSHFPKRRSRTRRRRGGGRARRRSRTNGVTFLDTVRRRNK